MCVDISFTLTVPKVAPEPWLSDECLKIRHILALVAVCFCLIISIMFGFFLSNQQDVLPDLLE